MDSESSCSSTTSRGNKRTKNIWYPLKSFEDINDYESFIKFQVPYNISRTSHQRTYCKKKSLDKHYTTIDKRKCKGHTSVISAVDKVELKCSVFSRISMHKM